MARFGGSFRSPEKQAASVMKALQGKEIASVRTVSNFENALTQVARSEFCQSQRMELRDMNPEKAVQYLEQRGEQVGQKTLDMERQALQKMMQHVSNKLDSSEKLTVVKSEHDQILNSRAYSQDQISLVTEAQHSKNALSTELAHAAGLRAHELLTIRPASEQPADVRPALDTKFQGREGQVYTVQGKGGLVREVVIPQHLSEKLEERRLESPTNYTDRGVHYTQHYDINGGNRWSSSFTTAANRSLGWSEGAHGLRHSYAQERMVELQVQHGLEREQALETVSQEMGHFRPEITEVYLR